MPNSTFQTSDLAVMRVVQRELVFYPLEENELRQLQTGYLSVHFALAGVSVGAAVSIAVTRLSGACLSEHAVIFLDLVLVVSILAAIYFGCMAKRDYSNCQRTLEAVRTTTTAVTVKSEVSSG